jgi:hypothetical protein
VSINYYRRRQLASGLVAIIGTLVAIAFITPVLLALTGGF